MTEDARQHVEISRQPLFTRELLFLSLSTLFCFASLFSVSPIFPLYIEKVGHGTDFQIGLVMGTFAVTSILLRPLVGRLSDRRGRKALLAAGVVTLGLSSVLFIASRDLVSMALVRALQGGGTACFHTLSLTMVGDMAPAPRRGQSMAFFMAFIEVGIAFSPTLGLYVLHRFGFNSMFLLGGLFALVSLFLLLPVPETKVRELAPIRAAKSKINIRSPVTLTTVTIFLGFLPVGAILSFLAIYTEQESIPQFGLYFTISSAIIIILRLLGGRLPDVLGSRWTVSLSLIILGASMFLLASSHSFAGLSLAACANGVGFAYAIPSLSALVTERVPPESLGIAFGIFTSGLEAGIFVGSVAMGAVASSWGLGASFWVSGLIALAGALFFLITYDFFVRGTDEMPDRQRDR